MSDILSQNESYGSQSQYCISRKKKPISKQELQNYEKNYPKNILIVILQFLKMKGSQNNTQNFSAKIEEIQKKNTVSLPLIFNILTHQHMQQIDKHQLQSYTCNKIVLNSKITKKVFHLKVIRTIFSLIFENDGRQIVTFKKQLSKKAKKISQDVKNRQEIFKYPSSIIYLLNFFYHVLQRYPYQLEKNAPIHIFSSLKLEQIIENAVFNMRKQKIYLLKQLIKKIVKLLNSKRLSKEKTQTLYDIFRDKIILQQQTLIQQNQLVKKAINLRYFCSQVLYKCLEARSLNKYIKINELYQWVEKCKRTILKCLQKGIDESYEQQKPQMVQAVCEYESLSYQFKPIILKKPPIVKKSTGKYKKMNKKQ